MTSSLEHSILFFFLHLKFFLLSLSLDSSTDIVEPYDPHISDLSASHFDCSKQHNLRQLSLTRVQPCAQAPSVLESLKA